MLGEYFSIAVAVGITNTFGDKKDKLDFFEAIDKPFLQLQKEMNKPQEEKDNLENMIDFLNAKAINNDLEILKK